MNLNGCCEETRQVVDKRTYGHAHYSAAHRCQGNDAISKEGPAHGKVTCQGYDDGEPDGRWLEYKEEGKGVKFEVGVGGGRTDVDTEEA